MEAELKPYERVLESVTGLATISRAESRERRGLRATPAPADPPETDDWFEGENGALALRRLTGAKRPSRSALYFFEAEVRAGLAAAR